jgi:hypothetical protein
MPVTQGVMLQIILDLQQPQSQLMLSYLYIQIYPHVPHFPLVAA